MKNKISKFALLAFFVSGLTITYGQNSYEDDKWKIFITEAYKIMNTDISTLKGTFMKMENNDSVFSSNNIFPGFDTHIRPLLDKDIQFIGESRKSVLVPDFSILMEKEKQLLTGLNYMALESEKGTPTGAQAEAFGVKKLIIFAEADKNGKSAGPIIQFSLRDDGSYSFAIHNNIYIDAKTPKVRPQSKFDYDFSDAPDQWLAFSNKFSSSEFKKGKWILKNKSENTRYKHGWEETFDGDFHIGGNSTFEVVGSFTSLSSVDSAYYGFLYCTKCKEDKLYEHLGFVINKKKNIFSIFEYSLNGDQTLHEAKKRYLVKDTTYKGTQNEVADILGIRRHDGKIFFSVNNEIVYSMGDAHPACPLSNGIQILMINKAELEIDDMVFIYSPNKESNYFKVN